MKKIYVLTTLASWSFMAYGQDTQPRDSNISIYHYNGNVGVGVTSRTE